MHTKKQGKLSATKLFVVAPIVLGLMISSQTFASDQKSVADKVYTFIATAQGKQEEQRVKVGSSIFETIQTLGSNIFKKNDERTIDRPLRASTNTIVLQEKIVHIDGSVFFADIQDHPYAEHISILASHDIVSSQENYNPDSHIRMSDLAKVIVQSYRTSVGLDLSTGTPVQFMQTAYNEGFFVGVMGDIDEESINKPVTYNDMEKILTNIHNQYPQHTKPTHVHYISDQIVAKGPMAYYIATIFDLTLEQDNYINLLYAPIKNSPHYEALRILIDNNIIDYHMQFDPQKQVSRSIFVNQVIKAYALSHKVLLTQTTHDISDLDGSDPLAKLVVFAYAQGRLDYMMIQTKGQIFFDPNRSITIDEVYEILGTITQKNFITGIIQPDTAVSQAQIAQLIVDSFGIQQQNSSNTQPSSNKTPLVQRINNLLSKI